MTETLVGARRSDTMTIRPYRPTDHRACRQLWAELAEEHAVRYEAPPAADPGAGFEEYLTRLDIGGMWVADDRTEGVVGFVGLILDGRAGEIDPVVVTTGRRGQGIGRSLLEYVAEQARDRGLRQLTVSPTHDALKDLGGSSFYRAARARRLLALVAAERKVAQRDLAMILADHASFPRAICRHVDLSDPEDERSESIYSVLLDLDDRRMAVAAGPPCQGEYVWVKLDEIV